MSKIITLGEPMVVFIAGETGELENVSCFERGLAGAEVNVSVGLTRLGHQVTYITRLGDDPYGHYIYNFIKDEGILTDGITIDKEYLTGSYLKGKTLVGDPDIFYYRKNSAASHISPEDIDAVSFDGAKWLHITGISVALSESCRNAVRRAIEKAREHGMTVSFDPNIRKSLWESEEEMRKILNEFAFLSDMILPGIEEGRILTGRCGEEGIAKFYLEHGCKSVVVKNGGYGAYYQSEENGKKGYAGGFKVADIVDTVGAGDGFATGVISACLEGLSLPDAVLRGNAIGAIVITAKSDNENLPGMESLQKFMLSHLASGRCKEAVSMDIYEQIQKARIMPLVTLDDPGQARVIGEALTECGLPVVEVTFRTDAAEEAIRIFTQEFPHILVGAGTVLSEEMADRAIRAGAGFILAPGINPEIVKYCQRRHIPVFPGCMTPTDLDTALRLGVDVVKIFPVVPMGGLPMLKAISAPFGKLRFVVTGGIDNDNLKEFLEFEKIISCGGSWLISKKRLREKDVEGLITDIKRAMVCLPERE